jgi:hypothetical protein
MKSDDGGVTFAQSDDFTIGGTTACFAPGMSRGGDGAINAGGLCGGSRFMRRSADDGLSWSTIMLVPIPMASAIVAHGSAADGTLWFTGAEATWVVRRRDTDGDIAVDDTFELAPGESSTPRWLTVGSRVYVGGTATDAADVQHAVVRGRYANGDWETIDDVPSAAAGTQLVQSADGTLIYLAVIGGADLTSAITRRSEDGGVTWDTIDTYALSGLGSTVASDLAVDPGGNLYSVYGADDGAGVRHWLVRRMDCL